MEFSRGRNLTEKGTNDKSQEGRRSDMIHAMASPRSRLDRQRVQKFVGLRARINSAAASRLVMSIGHDCYDRKFFAHCSDRFNALSRAACGHFATL